MFVQLMLLGESHVAASVTCSSLEHPFSLSPHVAQRSLFRGRQLQCPRTSQMWHERACLPGALVLMLLLQPWAYIRQETDWSLPQREPGKGSIVTEKREAAILILGQHRHQHITPTIMSRSTLQLEE